MQFPLPDKLYGAVSLEDLDQLFHMLTRLKVKLKHILFQVQVMVARKLVCRGTSLFRGFNKTDKGYSVLKIELSILIEIKAASIVLWEGKAVIEGEN